MCRRLSPLNAIGFVLLIASGLACALSFAAPFWLVYPHAFKWWKIEGKTDSMPDLIKNTIGIAWKGLLAYCQADRTCQWVWEDNFKIEKELPDWYKVSQIVYMAALASLVMAFILQCVYSCCRCCKQPGRFPTVVASFTIIGGLLVFLSLGVFGGFAHADGWFDKSTTEGFIANLEWAFYVGVGGAAGAILTAIIFFIDGCCMIKTYRGYSAPKS